MTRAHVLAKAVDVIPDYIYYWRERAAGELSITQNRTDIQNLRDRITALLAIDAFLREHAPAKTLRQHQRKALVNDLWLYVRDLYRVSDDYLTEYFDLVNSYLDQVGRRVFADPARHPQARLLPDPQAAAQPAARASSPGSSTRRWPPIPVVRRSRQAARRSPVPHRQRAEDPVPGLPALLAGPGPVRAGGERGLAAGQPGHRRPGLRALHRHQQAAPHQQDRGPAPPAPVPAADRVPGHLATGTPGPPSCPARSATTTRGRGSAARSAPAGSGSPAAG